jgi:hypothetical protein
LIGSEFRVLRRRWLEKRPVKSIEKSYSLVSLVSGLWERFLTAISWVIVAGSHSHRLLTSSLIILNSEPRTLNLQTHRELCHVSLETSFNSQISKIKRRVVFQAIHRGLLNASVIFLAISSVYAILNLTGITNYGSDGTWYILPAILSLATALFIGFVKRSNLLKILIDIDRRLKLEDRVSTAYEYLQFKKKTEFSDLLINDAAVRLRQIRRRHLVPAQFSFLHLLVIILLVINMLLYSGLLFKPDFKSTRRELEKLDQAGQLLKNFMIKRIDSNTVPQSTTPSGHAQNLEQISKKLNDTSKSFEQRLGALDSFLEAVQGEQARLAQELGARLESTGINKLSVPKTPDLVNLSSSQLEKLKGFLSRTLNNPLPDAIDRDIESLQELDSIENLISRIIDDLKDARTAIDNSVQSAIVKDGQMPPLSKSPENQAGEPIRPNPNSDRNRNAGERADHSDFDKLQRKGDGLQDGMTPPEGYSNAAGNAKAKEENQSSHDIEKTQRLATQDKLASAPAKTYLLQIRALTDKGEARVEEEEILRTYRREVESILRKENIPVNYREYIKKYFISIGINTKETAHEPK